MKSSVTERQNPVSEGIDQKSTLEILEIMNNEDLKIPEALTKILPTIAEFIDRVVQAFSEGGRLIYIGAGTSGRLGVLDASECPPTFGTDPEQVQGLIAGSKEALTRSIENAEDDSLAGENDLKQIDFNEKDVLLGITASGGAPYVLAALQYARSKGATTGAISCNPNSKVLDLADHPICAEVGPEIVAGSTRLKAGTVQKLILNMISTASMIRIGKVYGNLMIDVKPVNKKLRIRAKNLIMQITGCNFREAENLFHDSAEQPKVAVLMGLLGKSRENAEKMLREQPQLRPHLESEKRGK